MKTKYTNIRKSIALAVGISTLTALPLLAGIGVGISINAPAPVVVAPAPPVVAVPVPDSYVWDGSEYVGVIGSQYYYLGPGNVWLTLDGPRLERWNRWEGGHHNWRSHMIHNDRFRHDAYGHDRDHGRDHDRR
jgi:hypothetical protein